jgi:hypothetical protein
MFREQKYSSCKRRRFFLDLLMLPLRLNRQRWLVSLGHCCRAWPSVDDAPYSNRNDSTSEDEAEVDAEVAID